MGLPPINNNQGTHHILTYLNNMGLHSLNYISTWDAQYMLWTGWQFPEVPAYLEAILAALQTHLHGIALIKQESEDEFRWDPPGSTYTIKVVYQNLCNMEYPTPIWSF